MNDALTTFEILQLRGPKNKVSAAEPYAYLVEPERSAAGSIVDVATLFLTNRECPYRCLMCDLWKNTLDEPVALGDIPTQIKFALERLPSASQIKLYNSGNFFDAKAIPKEDFKQIAKLCDPFENVIVENHPKLCNDQCLRFQEMVGGDLEIAMGLETIHPQVLPKLNKQMTLADFEKAAKFLTDNGINIRAFVLLRPPYLDEEEGIEWALKTVDFAVNCGVQCVAVIPTRRGNGAIELLESRGQFSPPKLDSLEKVMDVAIQGIRSGLLGSRFDHAEKPRVFVDLWDAEKFATCELCAKQKVKRLEQMNFNQSPAKPIDCQCQHNMLDPS